MRIAVLEDDVSQIELLTHWLKLAGHEAEPFEQGQALLEAMTRARFDMLIIDWNLPDLSGVDVLKRIRQSSKVPALFCTVRGDQDDVVKALRAGASPPASPADAGAA